MHPFTCQTLLSSNPKAADCEFCHLKYLPDHKMIHAQECRGMKKTMQESSTEEPPPGFLRCEKCSSLLGASEMPRHKQCHEISDNPEEVIESAEALIEEIAHNVPTI